MSGPKVTLSLSMSETAALIERATGRRSQPALDEINAGANRDELVASIVRKAQRELAFIYRRRRARRVEES